MLILVEFVGFTIFIFYVLVCNNNNCTVPPQAYRLERPPSSCPRLASPADRGVYIDPHSGRDSPGASREEVRRADGTYAPVPTQDEGAPRWERGNDDDDDDLDGRQWRRRRRSQRHEGKGCRPGSADKATAIIPAVHSGEGAASDLGEWEGRGREEDEEGGLGRSAPDNVVNGGYLTLSGGMGDRWRGSRQQEAVVRRGEGVREVVSEGNGACSERNGRDSAVAATAAAAALGGNSPSSLKVGSATFG